MRPETTEEAKHPVAPVVSMTSSSSPCTVLEQYSRVVTFQPEESDVQRAPSAYRAESIRGLDPLAQIGRGDSAFTLINADGYWNSVGSLLNPLRQTTIHDASKLLAATTGHTEEEKKEESARAAVSVSTPGGAAGSSFLEDFVAQHLFAKSDVVVARAAKDGKGENSMAGKETTW